MGNVTIVRVTCSRSRWGLSGDVACMSFLISSFRYRDVRDVVEGMGARVTAPSSDVTLPSFVQSLGKCNHGWALDKLGGTVIDLLTWIQLSRHQLEVGLCHESQRVCRTYTSPYSCAAQTVSKRTPTPSNLRTGETTMLNNTQLTFAVRSGRKVVIGQCFAP
jgi:hypothetical protein